MKKRYATLAVFLTILSWASMSIFAQQPPTPQSQPPATPGQPPTPQSQPSATPGQPPTPQSQPPATPGQPPTPQSQPSAPQGQAAPSQAQPPQAAAQQQAAVPASESALTNQDIIRLSKMGLGDEVVIAKIDQARNVDFKLDTSDLLALKGEGVSEGVITAMLKRTSAPQGQSSPPSQGSGGGANYARPPWAVNPGDEGVVLRTNQGETRLQSVQGDISTTWAYVVTLLFLDFPGLKADVRITDPRPTLVVHCSKSPRGRVFLVKCKENEKDNNRSVKVGKMGMFSQKSWSSPDGDWTVAFDIKELPNDTWEITPKQDMKKGEYGVLFKGGFFGMLGPTQGELFDFGVDK